MSSDSFTISAADAYRVYWDYYVNGNTFGTSNSVMATIRKEYADKLDEWNASIRDVTKYEFDNRGCVAEGYTATQKATGYSGDNTGQKINTVDSAITGTASAVYAVGNVAKVAKEGTGIIANLFKGGAKGASTTSSASSGLSNTLAIVAAGIAIAEAAKYWAITNQQDAEITDALLELTDMMNESNDTLNARIADLSDTEAQIEDLQEGAQEANDEGNAKIEEKTAEAITMNNNYLYYKEKIASGNYTAEDKKLYKSMRDSLPGKSEEIRGIADETSGIVNDKYSDIEGASEIFDEISQDIGTIQGTTDYAASFDKSASTSFTIEGFAQTANAASAAAAGARLIATGVTPFTAWKIAIGIAAIAAGVSSGFAAAKEFSNAAVGSNEVSAREYVQVTNEATADANANMAEYCAGALGDIENFEIDISDLDDIEITEDDPDITDDGKQGNNKKKNNGSV